MVNPDKFEQEAFNNFTQFLRQMGTPSRQEFHDFFWKYLCPADRRHSVRAWQVLYIRGMLRLCSTAKLMGRLNRASTKAKARFMRRVHRRLGGSWNSPYALFVGILRERFSKDEFLMWWRGLSDAAQHRLYEVFFIWRKTGGHFDNTGFCPM